MLFAWQIGNLSTASLTVQSSTVLSSPYTTGKLKKHSQKDKVPVVSNDSIKMSKLYADSRDLSLLSREAEIVQQCIPPIYSVEDLKVEGGFDFIITFPDKLS